MVVSLRVVVGSAVAVVLAAGSVSRAGIIYVSQSRETSAFAALGTGTQSQTITNTLAAPMDATAQAQVIVDPGSGPILSRSSSRMVSDLTASQISVTGTYVLLPGNLVGTGVATGRSILNIVFQVDQPSPYTLSGLLPGVPFDPPFDPTPRVVRLSGPGLDVSAPNGAFSLNGVLQPGQYTYQVDVLSRVPGPAGDNSEGFAIPTFNATLNVIPVPGTLGALGVVGLATLSRRRAEVRPAIL